MLTSFFFIFIAICMTIVSSQIPCDDAYGEFCPDKAGADVGTCLKAHGLSKLSKACQEYIALHDTCASDIQTHCAGKDYTGDLLVCLSEWTKPDLISDECKAAFPKKQAEVEVEKTPEMKKKADARRRSRNKAMRQMKKEL